MPGPISSTTEELIEDIRTYDAAEYEERYRKFCEKYNSIDDGKASGHVLDLIHSLIPQKRQDVFYDAEDCN